MASLLGSVGEFVLGEEDWNTYIERLEIFLSINNVESTRHAGVLLSTVGKKTYALIQDLCSPTMPTATSYAEIVALVRAHYNPEPNLTAERHRFSHRRQHAGESIADYVAALRHLAKTCKFLTTVDERLRDQFVEGLRDKACLRKLLSVRNLTFATAIEQAIALEVANKDAEEIKADSSGVQVHSVRSGKGRSDTPGRHESRLSKVYEPCGRCGKTNHTSESCFARNKTGLKCGKKGHFASVCSSKSAKAPARSRKKDVKTMEVEDGDDLPFFCVSQEGISDSESDTQDEPIMLEVTVGSKHMKMELDTGAAVSVMSAEMFRNNLNATMEPTNIQLKPYKSKERIKPLGKFKIPVTFKGRTKSHRFYVVEGSEPPLLGRPWIRDFHGKFEDLNNLAKDSSRTLQGVIDRHSTIFRDELGCITNTTAKLQLKPNTIPVFKKFRPIPFAVQDKVEEELNRLQSIGILVPVKTSKWATPIVPVMKPNGEVRICADYKVTLNPWLLVDQYPLPTGPELFSKLAGGAKFTKLDQRHAYAQVPLDDASQALCTINTHMGLFRVTRLMYGISSAPAIFQRAMDAILSGVSHCVNYLDDTLITEENDAKHLAKLDEVLGVLEAAGIRLGKLKCTFMAPEVEYLGHKITKEGVQPTNKKIDAIVKAKAPQDKTQLRAFLGSLNFYGKFLPSLANVLHPLYQLLQDRVKWNWNATCQEAFNRAKLYLTKAPVLTHYNPRLPVEVFCDASSYGVGAVLVHVLPDGSRRPIAFASTTLNSAEAKYSQIDKEALALKFSAKKFHQYLFGRHFTLWTDHRPLIYLFKPSAPLPTTLSLRMQRAVLFLSGYSYDIKYISTKQNVLADMLSRLPMVSSSHASAPEVLENYQIQTFQTLPVTVPMIAKFTRRDPVLSPALQFTKDGWPDRLEDDRLRAFFSRRAEFTVLQDCLLWGNRVVVPPSSRLQVLKDVHEGHLGVSRMKNLARQHIWWPSMDQDIEEMVRGCVSCQETKDNPPRATLHPWDWPSRPMERIHADFAGPVEGSMYLLILDAHSKWPEVVRMPKTTAEDTIWVFRNIFARLGLPSRLVTDNGPQFRSVDFAAFTKACGITHTFSAPYHPATNGAAENFVKSFKRAMKAGVKDGHNADEALLRFLSSYRCTPHSTTGVTPAELFYGRRLRTRLSLVHPSLAGHVRSRQDQQRVNYRGCDRPFLVGEDVLVKDYRRGHTWTAGVVTNSKGPRNYTVETANKHEWKRHTDQLWGNSSAEGRIPHTITASDTLPEPVTPKSSQEPTSRISSPISPGLTQPPLKNDTPEETPMPRRSTRVLKPPDRLQY